MATICWRSKAIQISRRFRSTPYPGRSGAAVRPCKRATRVENVLVSALGLSDSAYDGDKVGIAVIDSGLEKSGDLSGGRADRFFDFTSDGKAGHPYDDYGHGTHVATLIAGEGKESEREAEVLENGRLHRSKFRSYRGVAPKARIISLKVLDRNGAGFTSSVLRALEFVVENREKLKIDIVNLSLGPSDLRVARDRSSGARGRRCGAIWDCGCGGGR